MVENLTTPDQQAAIGVNQVNDGCGGPALAVRDTLDFVEPVSSDDASLTSCGSPNGCPFAERVSLSTWPRTAASRAARAPPT
jgi:hypothetical protein